ncbi:hypothetical protein NZA98_01990, partial [Escherichia coli]|nr:hypothetical protein [Escherichia coli]
QQGGTIRAKNAGSLAFMIGNRLIQVRSVAMPARRYLGLSADNQNDVVEAAEDWLSRLVQ